MAHRVEYHAMTIRRPATNHGAVEPTTIEGYLSEDNLDRATRAALRDRRAAKETMTYFEDGWVMREHPDGRVERLTPIVTFRATDFLIQR